MRRFFSTRIPHREKSGTQILISFFFFFFCLYCISSQTEVFVDGEVALEILKMGFVSLLLRLQVNTASFGC